MPRVLSRRGRCSLLLLVLLGVAAQLAGGAHGQETSVPSADEIGSRVQAIHDAFQTLADQARAGSWQAADDAFNAALDAVDANRAPLETALGDRAREAFGRADALLADLVAGLDAEDASGVGAVVTMIQSEIDALAPDGAAPALAARETQTVLTWRAAAAQVRSLSAVGSWRDMRNTAMALVSAIETDAAAVAAAAGPEGESDVDVARVFAMRLVSAALNQAPADTEVAGDLFDEATRELLERIGAEATPVPTTGPDVRLRFRAYEVPARVGEVVVVTVAAEDIPRIGLGACDLVVRWSPTALRLIDVTWDVAAGIVARHDASGSVQLTLPLAPTGPAGDAILAHLEFEALAARCAPTDYLPADEVAVLQDAAADAREAVREGDVPRAAAALEDAYVAFVGGRTRPGSLHDLLAASDLAEPLRRALLLALDAASRPAESDVILLALTDLEGRLAVTWAAALAALGGDAGVPIAIEVRSARDTTGAELPVLPSAHGLVTFDPTGTASDTPDAAGGTGRKPIAPTSASVGAATRATAGAPQSTAAGASGGRFPIAVVLALAVGAVLGGITLWMGERGGAGDEGDDEVRRGAGDPPPAGG